MDSFLLLAAVTLGFAVLIGLLNEKLFHLTYEIALLLFSVLIGICLTVGISAARDTSVRELLQTFQVFNLETFLMKGVLCFMLFAGACHLKLHQFKAHAREISVLAFFVTLVGALFYGFLFWGISQIFHLPFSLPVCLMFGSITAPTDPIAATSILKQFGLPKLTGFLMEGESLLNDGVGVALFVVFSQLVKTQEGGGFLAVMLREIIGAVLVGSVVTLITFQAIRLTKDRRRKILASLFMVSCSYALCELLECSGAIACVVCGVVFSTLRERNEQTSGGWEDGEVFDGFWEVIDVLLNSTLYVIMGLSFVRILQMPSVLLLSFAAILCNLVSRSGSLWAGTYLIGPIPDGFDRKGFTLLLTWGGLKGGLSIALAMSTASLLQENTYHILLGCVYAIVFFTTVVQGLTMKRVYQGIRRT